MVTSVNSLLDEYMDPIVGLLRDSFTLLPDLPHNLAIQQPQLSQVVDQMLKAVPLIERSLMLQKPMKDIKSDLKKRVLQIQNEVQALKQNISSLEQDNAQFDKDKDYVTKLSDKNIQLVEISKDLSSDAKNVLDWMNSGGEGEEHEAFSYVIDNLEKSLKNLDYLPRERSFFEKKKRTQTDNEIKFGNDGNLRAATVDKMIELVVMGSGNRLFGSDFGKTFITCYTWFIDKHDLLERLMLLYCTSPPVHLPTKEGKNKVGLLRGFILNILKRWIAFHPYDFEGVRVQGLLTNFIDQTLKLTGYERFSHQLKKQMKQAQDRREQIKKINVQRSLYKGIGNVSPDMLFLFDELEIARQITLEDFDAFRRIHMRDLINCAWSDEDSPHGKTVAYMTKFFQNTAAMVTGMILNCGHIVDEQESSKGKSKEELEKLKEEKRGRYISLFLRVSQHLLDLNNFNACFSILGALGTQAVYRLKRSWEHVPKELLIAQDEMKKLMDSNWKLLRATHTACTPPLVPYIGVYLTDLTFINEMRTMEDKVGELYNWVKFTRITQAIEKILLHQNKPYQFTRNDAIFEIISDPHCRLDGEEAFQRSLVVEPKIPSFSTK